MSLKNQNSESDGKFIAEQMNIAWGQVLPEDAIVSADNNGACDARKACNSMHYKWKL